MSEQLFVSTTKGAEKLRIAQKQLDNLCPFLVHIAIKSEQRATSYLLSIDALRAFADYTEEKSWRATRVWAKKFAQTPEAVEIANIVPRCLDDFLKNKEVFLVDELSIVLGVSQDTIFDWIKAGMLGASEKQLVRGRMHRVVQRKPLQQLLICTVP